MTGAWSLIPLAGPANRQGPTAADSIFGRPSRYKGTCGTAILCLFDLTAACTGASEKTLRSAGIPFEVVHLYPSSRAGYSPGGSPIALKLLFTRDTGKILGAQAVGREGVDKRIDVLATALQAGMTVHDLAELKLAYAPPFSAAKDPVNLAGMIAQNALAGDVSVMQWHEIADLAPTRASFSTCGTTPSASRGYIPYPRFHPHPARTAPVALPRIAMGSPDHSLLRVRTTLLLRLSPPQQAWLPRAQSDRLLSEEEPQAEGAQSSPLVIFSGLVIVAVELLSMAAGIPYIGIRYRGAPHLAVI